MTDPQTAPAGGQAAGGAATSVLIPDDLRAKHPGLIDLILHSESMNDEERQYWINILPIMTPEQVKNLLDILTTERTQLAAIDAQYTKAVDAVGQEEFLRKTGEERRHRARQRTEAERAAQAQEQARADDVLKGIEGA